MTTSIKEVITADWVEMNGHPLRQPLPNRKLENIGPLLLIHHHQTIIEPGSRIGEIGVGPHPHTGFAPVTFIFKGDVNHRDSRGNNSVVEAGGVQWMNAGKGIVHSERPSAELAKNGGEQEIIQIWINSPAKHKFDLPVYFALNKTEIPVINNHHVTIKVVAGTYENITGFNQTQSNMVLLEIHNSGEAKQTINFNASWEHAIYNLDETININGQDVFGSQLVVFEKNTQSVDIQFNKPTRLLVFDMEAINEPIATYGPFVMNNQTQIMQAMRDYQMGKMGVLIEEF